MAEHNEIGKNGEKIACLFLVKHGFRVLETNYWTKYGEIDIVAQKDQKLHFIEVKSVKVNDFERVSGLRVQPEDNLTNTKWGRFTISVETYLQHKEIDPGILWCIDLACVYIKTSTREGKVKFLENIHKE